VPLPRPTTPIRGVAGRRGARRHCSGRGRRRSGGHNKRSASVSSPGSRFWTPCRVVPWVSSANGGIGLVAHRVDAEIGAGAQALRRSGRASPAAIAQHQRGQAERRTGSAGRRQQGEQRDEDAAESPPRPSIQPARACRRAKERSRSAKARSPSAAPGLGPPPRGTTAAAARARRRRGSGSDAHRPSRTGSARRSRRRQPPSAPPTAIAR
jgi:hypothetical protein